MLLESQPQNSEFKSNPEKISPIFLSSLSSPFITISGTPLPTPFALLSVYGLYMVNILKFQKQFSFSSQIKPWWSRLEFTNCLSEKQTEKTYQTASEEAV